MRTPEVQSAAFPTARCVICEEVVLTYVTIDAVGNEARRCVDCDSDINEQLQWISAGDLEELGYSFGAPGKKTGGCGSGGCGSCSR
jgi:hypothetical protein